MNLPWLYDVKPVFPSDLGSCYAEIAKQTKRANEAEYRRRTDLEAVTARLHEIERHLRPPGMPTGFYPGKYATKRPRR
jgi:hypothetical protein